MTEETYDIDLGEAFSSGLVLLWAGPPDASNATMFVRRDGKSLVASERYVWLEECLVRHAKSKDHYYNQDGLVYSIYEIKPEWRDDHALDSDIWVMTEWKTRTTILFPSEYGNFDKARADGGDY